MKNAVKLRQAFATPFADAFAQGSTNRHAKRRPEQFTKRLIGTYDVLSLIESVPWAADFGIGAVPDDART